MRSVQIQQRFELASVKPFERLAQYRQICLDRTRQALAGPSGPRRKSPAGGGPLEPAGSVEGIDYLRCVETGSLFLAKLPDWKEWSKLLEEVSRARQSPQAFHSDLEQSRVENVYLPKLEWVQEALRLQGVASAVLLEAASLPAALGPLFKENGSFADVITVDEMKLAHVKETPEQLRGSKAQAALLLESLDRVDDPQALIDGVRANLTDGGLLFVTALAASGFDMVALGFRNRYFYPPDRANCFTLPALTGLLERSGFELIEVSTPGVLDLEIVASHLKADPSIPLGGFEKSLVSAGTEIRSAFQGFLQQNGLSSFARLVARKKG